jgi:hypothetical protein
VKLQSTRTAYPKEYSNTVRPMTMLPLLRNGQPTTTSDRKTLKESSYLSKLQKEPFVWVLFIKELGHKLRGYRVHILRRDFHIFFSSEDSRPSNFLFQIARGSRDTLSEWLFLWKSARHSRIFSGKTTSRFLFEGTRTRLASPGKTWGSKEAFEFYHEMLGGLSIWDP